MKKLRTCDSKTVGASTIIILGLLSLAISLLYPYYKTFGKDNPRYKMEAPFKFLISENKLNPGSNTPKLYLYKETRWLLFFRKDKAYPKWLPDQNQIKEINPIGVDGNKLIVHIRYKSKISKWFLVSEKGEAQEMYW